MLASYVRWDECCSQTNPPMSLIFLNGIKSGFNFVRLDFTPVIKASVRENMWEKKTEKKKTLTKYSIQLYMFCKECKWNPLPLFGQVVLQSLPCIFRTFKLLSGHFVPVKLSTLHRSIFVLIHKCFLFYYFSLIRRHTSINPRTFWFGEKFSFKVLDSKSPGVRSRWSSLTIISLRIG